MFIRNTMFQYAATQAQSIQPARTPNKTDCKQPASMAAREFQQPAFLSSQEQLQPAPTQLSPARQLHFM
jgi:hypothetical protein